MMLDTYVSDIQVLRIIDHQYRPLYHIQVSTNKCELNASTVCVHVLLAHVYVRGVCVQVHVCMHDIWNWECESILKVHKQLSKRRLWPHSSFIHKYRSSLSADTLSLDTKIQGYMHP